jgi:hypothetical protein
LFLKQSRILWFPDAPTKPKLMDVILRAASYHERLSQDSKFTAMWIGSRYELLRTRQLTFFEVDAVLVLASKLCERHREQVRPSSDLTVKAEMDVCATLEFALFYEPPLSAVWHASEQRVDTLPLAQDLLNSMLAQVEAGQLTLAETWPVDTARHVVHVLKQPIRHSFRDLLVQLVELARRRPPALNLVRTRKRVRPGQHRRIDESVDDLLLCDECLE